MASASGHIITKFLKRRVRTPSVISEKTFEAGRWQIIKHDAGKAPRKTCDYRMCDIQQLGVAGELLESRK